MAKKKIVKNRLLVLFVPVVTVTCSVCNGQSTFTNHDELQRSLNHIACKCGYYGFTGILV